MSGYILRHKLKNPAYASEPNHQWFNIVDIFNNGTENEIHLHGILKDKDSVSTDNIEDHAVTAIKTDFLILGSNKTVNKDLKDSTNNYLTIYPASISESDLDPTTVANFTTIPALAINTGNIKDLAVTSYKLADEAVTAAKLDPNLDWNIYFTNNDISISGSNLTDGSISGEKLNTKLLGAIISTADDLDNMFDSTQTGALSDWDQNHLGIWIKI